MERKNKIRKFLENKLEALACASAVTIHEQTQTEIARLIGTYQLIYKAKYGEVYKTG